MIRTATALAAALILALSAAAPAAADEVEVGAPGTLTIAAAQADAASTAMVQATLGAYNAWEAGRCHRLDPARVACRYLLRRHAAREVYEVEVLAFTGAAPWVVHEAPRLLAVRRTRAGAARILRAR